MKTFKVTETISREDNLCNYCHFNYPDCVTSIKFGNGLGSDNIVGCEAFDGDADHNLYETKEISEEEFNSNYE